MESRAAKLELMGTMVLFGSIGTMSRFIDAPSAIIALARSALGVLSIIIFMMIRRRPLDLKAIKRNAPWLLLSSTLMGVNWVCQFEAFKHTTIATGTLCYYTQPIFYIIAGIVILKEAPSVRKIACIIVAFIGMIFVSGVIQVGFDISELKGALYGIAGGFFYAMVVLINKYMKDISPIDTTIAQLATVSVLMSVYSKLTGAYEEAKLDARGIACLLLLGLLYTGIAYMIYFDAVNKLSTQTAGIISYIDPVEAVLLSAFFLREPITIYTIIGSALILGATAVSELAPRRNDAEQIT